MMNAKEMRKVFENAQMENEARYETLANETLKEIEGDLILAAQHEFNYIFVDTTSRNDRIVHKVILKLLENGYEVKKVDEFNIKVMF